LQAQWSDFLGTPTRIKNRETEAEQESAILRRMEFTEKFFSSRDGLQLYYRDYPGDAGKAPVLCLHGLTRNSRDFAALAEHIAPARRVIVPDQRGRGRSQYDANWMNYHPGTYVGDMWTLLRELSVQRVIVIGTSLGGLMAMLMASMRPQMLAGVVLNDIGPELDPAGIMRIQSYAGRLPPVRTWNDAAAQMKTIFGAAMPDYDDRRWHEFARLAFDDADGVPRLAADPKIGDAVRSIPPPPNAVQGMWLAFGQLRGIPSLALRGSHSDLLPVATFERMQTELPELIAVTVPNRGHAPQLDEPQSLQAIDAFLGGLRE
jgi:pimeloyl-ACP methyl ester carboxylesterase